MKYKSITYPDVNNGLGCRVSLWVSGCTHKCEGCHNQSLWDFSNGKEFNDEIKLRLYNILSLPYIKGITLTGGDPLLSFNDILSLCKDIRVKFPNKDIWLYTGFTMDYIANSSNMSEILNYIDVLVDGKYVSKLRDISLAFRGSTNQHIWMKNENGEFEIKDAEF